MKLLLVGILSLIALQTIAQPKKGIVTIGGELNYSKTTFDKYVERESYIVNPQIGVYLKDYFMVGVGYGIEADFESERIRVGVGDFTGGTDYEESNTKFSFFTGFLNAHKKINDKLYFNTNIQSKFGNGSNYYSNGSFNYRGDLKLFELMLRPGIFYFLTPHVILTGTYGSISYWKLIEEYDFTDRGGPIIEEKNKNFEADFTFTSFQLGVQFIFPNNK